ncbi:YybS family protein [Bacillus shivajii]|uniref:YybS family protein n=1 Tax=Bacillus shivajii TaxID=1983719 RepID=UPI001CF9BF32|nr:YybS family protein [Bacillus shivajii]UCZ53233.1 YybS family protein [Bacillus shivajii]
MDRSTLQQGAIFLTIFLVLAFLTILVPFIGMFTLFLLPIPFVFFTYKFGLKPAIYLALFSFFISFLLMGPFAIPLTVSFVIGGVVIGEMYRRKKHAFAVLLGGSLSFIGALLVNFVGSILVLDIHPIEELQSLLKESVELSEEILGAAVALQDAGAVETAYEFIDQLVYITPTLLIILGVGYAFIVQWLASLFLRRKKYEIELFPPLRTWTFPKAFIWYYLITYIFIIIGVEEGTAVYTVIANLTPILEIVMIIQGFAFMFFFFHYKKMHVIIPIVLMIFAFVVPILLHIVRILGIIDLGFDLRKRLNSKK